MSPVTELKHRNVFWVGAAYGILAWLLIEVASVVLPAFEATVRRQIIPDAWIVSVREGFRSHLRPGRALQIVFLMASRC
jgi:hypothetical protein